MENTFTLRRAPGAFLFVFLLAGIPTPKLLARQQTQTPPKGSDPFHVVKSLVGAKEKAEGMKFVVEDRRTTFHLPRDKQVVVYFEWEGPPGAHHFQGTWIEPTGKIEGTSTFEYVTPISHFSGYWVLRLNNTVPRGLWALQAQIDGKPAGERTFLITGMKSVQAPAPLPTTAQVYQQVLASSVFVTALGPREETIRTGSGFFIRPGVVLTTFGVIDGSTSLQVQLPNGSTLDTKTVLASNREQDWALLALSGAKVPPLKLAQPGSWKVGDVCYVTGSPSPGARAITAEAITGIARSKSFGQRFTVSWTGEGRAAGSPVLDTAGRVIGMMKLSPSFGRNEIPTGSDFTRFGSPPSSGPQVVPIGLVQNPALISQPTTLAELAARGEFIPPVARDSQVAYGYLCRNFKWAGGFLSPTRITSQFFPRDRKIAVLVVWTPDRKVRTTDQVRIYSNRDNGLRLESRLKKIRLWPHRTLYTGWRIPISSLPPGLYRVDVVLGKTPEWRSFFLLRK